MELTRENIKTIIRDSKTVLDQEKDASPALLSMIELQSKVLETLLIRFSLTSRNSSKSPSSDPNREKTSTGKSSGLKPGGQPGRVGKNLKRVADPDEIKIIELDRSTLPEGEYRDAGYEARQVFDIKVTTHVTEYRAQVLKDSQGHRYVAPFPEHVKSNTQYGSKVKSTSVYMSQYQMLPYGRINDYFSDQLGLPVSQGSVFNFNQEAYQALEKFENLAKSKLINSPCIHVDETGINLNGKKIWLHTACNDLWTHFSAHVKRGTEAMNAAGILPKFKGVMVHDLWKPYYTYDCQHALCNAHLLRDLTWSLEEDDQAWAGDMSKLLLSLNKQTKEAGGTLTTQQHQEALSEYEKILARAEKECPPPLPPPGKKKRGRIKKSKSRNLLERFLTYKDDILRFTENINVPFTNNLGENDLRMTKVQQKISGCFRSEEGANIFCRVRGYLNTCRKHNLNMTESLEMLFCGQLPDFDNLDPPGE